MGSKMEEGWRMGIKMGTGMGIANEDGIARICRKKSSEAFFFSQMKLVFQLSSFISIMSTQI